MHKKSQRRESDRGSNCELKKYLFGHKYLNSRIDTGPQQKFTIFLRILRGNFDNT